MLPIRLPNLIGIPKRIPDAVRAVHAPIGRCRALGTSPTNHVGQIAPGAARKSGTQEPWIKRYNTQQQQFMQWNGIRKTTTTWPRAGSQPKTSNATGALGLFAGAAFIAVLAAPLTSSVKDSGEDDALDHNEAPDTASRKIRLAEVVKHDKSSDAKWVIRGSAVYNITEFIETHPGGEVILRACGGSIDPYWKLFSIHNKPEVRQILEQYRIGSLDDRDLDDQGNIDWSVLCDSNIPCIDDPFKDDPERDPELIIQTAKPCNAETPGKLLGDFITPLRLFFVRHHLWVPVIDSHEHKLTIELSDGEKMSYSMDDLKHKFQEHTITVTLQCAGNRRSHMSKSENGKTSGLQWDVGAIGTAEFTGVRLRDVLLDAGYDVNAACQTCPKDEDADQHVHFCAPSDTYEQSIPIQTALNPTSDVLLAWKMNNEEMPRDHGGPLRAIVPGSVATRSVKWLGRVRISCDESQSNWHARDYKSFPPNVRAADVTAKDWQEAPSMQEMPVQSVITRVDCHKEQESVPVVASGFAYSGGGRKILRVDVSANGGKTWRQAQLQEDDAKGTKRWAWTQWTIEWQKDQLPADGKAEFVVKAVDEGFNTQPQAYDATWNFRGLMANAWHRVPFAH